MRENQDRHIESLQNQVSELSAKLGPSHTNCDYWKSENGRVQSQIIDLINDYLQKHTRVNENVEFRYISDISIKAKLYNKYSEFEKCVDDIDKFEFERKHCSPALLIINPIEKEFSIFSEKFIPFIEESIEQIFKGTKLEE